MIARIIHQLLDKLVKEDKVLLSADADIPRIAMDIVSAMPRASFASHFGSWFSNQLIEHPMIEELFASDGEITDRLKELGME